MYPVQTADVTKLKCLLFEFLRDYIEQLMYGIICNKEQTYEDMLKTKAYLFIINSCLKDDDYFTHCLILDFINKKYDDCIDNLDICTEGERETTNIVGGNA